VTNVRCRLVGSRCGFDKGGEFAAGSEPDAGFGLDIGDEAVEVLHRRAMAAETGVEGEDEHRPLCVSDVAFLLIALGEEIGRGHVALGG
jgi:hypothetical protein